MDKVEYDLSNQIFFELGSALAEIHKDTNTKFGFLYNHQKIGSDPRVHNSYPGPYNNGFDQHYMPAKGWTEHLVNKKSRYSKQLKKIMSMMKKEQKLFIEEQRTYNHGDYQFKNFLVTKEKLVGIVDFDSYRVGDPSSDLHMFLQNCFDKNIEKTKIKMFIDGYSKSKELPINFFDKGLFYRCYRGVQEVISIPFHLRYAKEDEVEPFKEKIGNMLDSIIEGNDLSLNVWGGIYGS
jgi:aminoglycoside phosphotransferase (APT) family kinase protein